MPKISRDNLPSNRSYLEGEDAVGAAQRDDADLAEGAAPDHLQDLEVVLA